ncbi:MAG: hypothetical protein ACRDGJ_11465 [Candidatus Limnocylindria bacterium]
MRRRGLRRLASRAIKVAVLPFMATWVVAAAIRERPASKRRRRSGARPRLAYGPVPIIAIKYMSQAMRRAGYETLTMVDDLYAINTREDFDRHRDTFFGRSLAGRLASLLVGDYLVFAWMLRRHDVFHFFFDGGFLRHTPMRFWELQLLHLAGKRVIAMPYGSDVAIPSRIRSADWRDGLLADYPQIGPDEPRRQRWVDYFSTHADYVVACVVHFETLRRWDLLTIHYYPIDTDTWSAPSAVSAGAGHDGRNGPVTVVHAPNHRAVNRSAAVIDACEALRAEGLQVELRLLEKVPNRRVHEEVARADILAEQLILGYGLAAIEGMSLGKPVVANLSDQRYFGEPFHRDTRFGDCPIVSATPETLRDELRRLVVDPALRHHVGNAGRAYVMREHSYAAMARLWDAIYRRVWDGARVDPSELLRPDTALAA